MKILSTKLLKPKLLHVFNGLDVKLTSYNAILIEYLDFKIDTSSNHYIFTSQNAVKAFLKCLPHSFNKAHILCYCVGDRTKKLLEKSGFKVVLSTHYGQDLADEIVKTYAEQAFVFYCGNKRRDVIPKILALNSIPIKEIVTYTTKLNVKAFDTSFDGVLFFSPTGVQSYTAANDLDATIAFCIGTTTADEAEKHTSTIVIAATPTVEQTLRDVKRYYTSLLAEE